MSSSAVATTAAALTAEPEKPKTVRRLVIRDIEVENFKSYQGRATIGPFHKTFTAVIGPNGSGKSNVIDAMLFVFGKNAKKIRLEKLSELIHSSAAYPNVQSASVTVNFVEIEDTLSSQSEWKEIRGTQIAVRREVTRTSSSQYYIQGKKSTQKEVVAFLIDKGVDLEHNRFLILQGEVEQIALMKPKAEKEGEEGLVEYFDELIGTNKYVDEIKRAAEIAISCQEDRLGALDTLNKLRDERAALDGARIQTLEYITKENQLQKLISALSQIRIMKVSEDLVVPRRKIALIEEEITHTQQKVKEQKVQQKEAEKAKKDADKRLAQHNKDLEKSQRKAQENDENLAGAKAAMESVEKERKKEEDRMKKLRDEIQTTSMKLTDLERDISIAEEGHKSSCEVLEEVEPQYERETDALQQTVLPPLRSQLEQERMKAAPFERSIMEAEERLKDAQHQLKTNRSRVVQLESQIKKFEDDRIHREQQLQTLSMRIKKTTEYKDTFSDRIAQVDERVTVASRTKHNVDRQIEQIKSEMRDGDSAGNVVKFLQQKNLRGYYGELRTLGEIGDEFDIAAGVAGGAQWGFHVVEDKDCASEAIRLLKNENIGRANFVVLDTLRNDANLVRKMNAAFNPGTTKVKRLYDLVSCEEHFKLAFYFTLKDTVVTNELQTAREVGLATSGRRLRCVTLKGELVEPSGVVTGGGSAAPRGANLKKEMRQEDKQKKRRRLMDLQQELQAAAGDEQEAIRELQDLQRAARAEQQNNPRLSPQQLRHAQEEADKLAQQVQLISEREEVLQEQLAKHNAAADDTTRKLEGQVEKAKSEVQSAEMAFQQVKDGIEEITHKINNVGSEEYHQLKERYVSADKRRKECEKKLLATKKEKQRMTVLAERRRRDLEQKERNLEAKLQSDYETAQEDLNAAQAKQSELAAIVSEHSRKLREASDEADAVKDTLIALERDLRTLTTELEDHQRAQKEIEDTMKKHLETIEKHEAAVRAKDEHVQNNIRMFGPETWQQNNDEQQNQDVQDDDGQYDEDGNPIVTQQTQRDLGSEDEDSSSPSQRKNKKKEKKKKDRKRDRSGDSRRRMGTPPPSGPVAEIDLETFTMRLPESALRRFDVETSKFMINALSEETQRQRESIDMSAVAAWRERDLAFRAQQDVYDGIRERLQQAEDRRDSLQLERKTKFMTTFRLIQTKLKEMYQLLANGGDAEVELLDTADPFEGINFCVRPPRKAWKNVEMLSGGEKTLSSLALIFALHHVKPTPVYVLDEIDAALDFRNVSIVGRYVLERAVGAQFIIISLRNNLFELAHQLIGIHKVSDCTRSTVLNPSAVAQVILRNTRKLIAKRPSHANTAQNLNQRHQNQQSGGGNNDTSSATYSSNNKPRLSIREKDENENAEAGSSAAAVPPPPAHDERNEDHDTGRFSVLAKRTRSPELS